MENRFQDMSKYLAGKSASAGRGLPGVGSRGATGYTVVQSRSMPLPAISPSSARTFSDAGAPLSTNMHISAAGVDFIKQFEGFEPRPKEDPAGHCSVGYGTLLHGGACNGGASEAPYINGISKEDATNLLAQEVTQKEAAIHTAAIRPLNQNQFDALASFVYNVGSGAFQRSTLAKLLAKGDYDGIPAELRKWTKARIGGTLVDLPGLVRRRKAEADLWQTTVVGQSQSIALSCLGVSLSDDKWDRIANKVYGCSSYDDYVQKELTSTTFLGQTVAKIGPQLVDRLKAAEAALQATSYTSSPSVDSTFRSRKGMHGWGLAVDFDVLEDPYVLNEAGEVALDKDLRTAYDRIADFVLGLPKSCLRKLTQGRSAFSNSINTLYDALSAESQAMRTYFRLMNDRAALTAFLANDWMTVHPGKSSPDAAKVQSQMQQDYETLGGKTAAGSKKPTGSSADRPFAPMSGGGAGDPATGFLNLDKDFVLALTGAGLAWGAIDMGGASGDIMHFDCRLDGKGQQAFQALLV